MRASTKPGAAIPTNFQESAIGGRQRRLQPAPLWTIHRNPVRKLWITTLNVVDNDRSGLASRLNLRLGNKLTWGCAPEVRGRASKTQWHST
jgi:hypothetical protein